MFCHGTFFTAEPQSTQRNSLSFHFLVRGQKVKNNCPSGMITFRDASDITDYVYFAHHATAWLLNFICRPLNGK
jgi:hypothetical protein